MTQTPREDHTPSPNELPIPATIIIPTLNESLAIEECIRSVLPYFAEVFVVDSMSSDDTRAIAERLGAQVVSYKWDGRYPKKKQWCLDRLPLSTDWVFFLDADERVTEAMIQELREVNLATTRYAAIDASFDYAWAGRPLAHGQRVWKRAIMNRQRCRFPEVDDLDLPGMGEQEGNYQPFTTGPVLRVTARLLHADPDPLADWFARHNRYSDWEAGLRLRPGARKTIRDNRTFQGRILDRLPLKPLAVFLNTYLVRGGWRDGWAGRDYAMALAFYHWQIAAKARALRHGNLASSRRPSDEGLTQLERPS